MVLLEIVDIQFKLFILQIAIVDFQGSSIDFDLKYKVIIDTSTDHEIDITPSRHSN